MKVLKLVAVGMSAAVLSACSSADLVSRNAPLSNPNIAPLNNTNIAPLGSSSIAPLSNANVTPLSNSPIAGVPSQPSQSDYALHSVRFVAPADLKVSESASYYPIADIVWRGDPMGNRREQISQIFETSIKAAGQGLTGRRPVIVDVELVRFHSLTERARYTIGGVHSIWFDLTIRDAETGRILEPSRRVNADLAGLGGQAAIGADAAGQGQKVRITEHLTSLFYRELSAPRADTQADVLMAVSSN